MTDPGNTLELFPLDDTQHLHDPSSARSDVRIGEAGELLTVSKLLKWGVKAFTVAAGDQYDILADVGGTLLRIQVKTSSVLKSSYSFGFHRGYYYSPKGIFGYADDDYDISACVNLYDEKVLFSPGVQKSITWKRGQFCQDGSERASWEHSCQMISRVPPEIPLIENG